MSESVKVAVRVRPFNSRQQEQEWVPKVRTVTMDGPVTYIRNPHKPDEKPRPFTYDFSYYSTDSDAPNFATNETVYNDIGKKILSNSLEGYNCCLFAYGQTGAGKSYSMVGYPGKDPGIVPRAMEGIFNIIESNEDPLVSYVIEASMLEIYNEKVKDLFWPENPSNKGGLRIIQKKGEGPTVQGLKKVVVTSYGQIQQLMDDGGAARTVAATQMNSTSSRAHTVFQIGVITKTKDETTGKTGVKSAQINLVDLAGSERAGKTGATGQTLKEGAGINLSLTNLGRVIAALAAGSKNVPFRDSALTYLLKNALGGNSKTVMIAAISPSGSEYDETLSTLRYADGAKQIKTKAVVNESEEAKLIKKLKKEIDELKRKLGPGGGGGGGVAIDPEEEARRQAEHEEFERLKAEMKRMKLSPEELKAQAAHQEEERLRALEEEQKMKASVPHIVNLHPDMVLSKTVYYYFKEGSTRVCQPNAEPPPVPGRDIQLRGLEIQKEHCLIEVKSDAITLSLLRPNAKVFVNGKAVVEPMRIQHQDRVYIGSHHCFMFVDPQHAGTPPRDSDGNPLAADVEIDFHMAQLELHETALSSFSQPVDEETQRKKEEAEKRAKALEEQIKAQREELEAAQAASESKQRLILQELEEKKKKELEEVRAQLNAEADQNKQQELMAALKAKEEEMAAEREQQEQKMRERFEAENKEKLELQAALKKQLEDNAKLQKAQKVEAEDKALLQEALITTIPMINEASTICKQLAQPLEFEITLRAKKADGIDGFTEKTDVLVKVTDTARQVDVIWNVDEFTENLFMMKEIHLPLLEDPDAVIQVPEDDDKNPFYIQAVGPQLIGSARLFLKHLYFFFPIKEKNTPIIDYKGDSQGKLHIKLWPLPLEYASDKEQKEDEEEDDGEWEYENLAEAKKDNLPAVIYRLEVEKILGVPQNRTKDVYIEYRFFGDLDPQRSEPSKSDSINAVLNYKRDIEIAPLSDEFISWVDGSVLEVFVYGSRPPEKADPNRLQHHRILSNAPSSRGSISGPPSPSHSYGGDDDEAAARELAEVQRLLGRSEKKGRDGLKPPGADTGRGSISAQVAALVDENEKLKVGGGGGGGSEVQKLRAELKKQEAEAVQARRDAEERAAEIQTLKKVYAQTDKPPDVAQMAKLQLENVEKEKEVARLKRELEELKKQKGVTNQKESKACIVM